MARLWISNNEKYATTVLMKLSKSCVFSGKEGLSPAGNEDGLLTASHPGAWQVRKIAISILCLVHRGLYAEKR